MSRRLSRLVAAEDRWFAERYEHPLWSRWPAMLTVGWWEFVCNDSRAHKEYGPWALYPRWLGWLSQDRYVPNPAAFVVNYLARCACRWKGHPCGVYWFSGGMEPDTRCRNCGEDIG